MDADEHRFKMTLYNQTVVMFFDKSVSIRVHPWFSSGKSKI